MSIRKIAIAGLEKNDKLILKAAIETASGFETGLWECTDNISLAQAIILDLNSKTGHKIIEDFAEKDNAPLLIGVVNKKLQDQTIVRFMIEQPLNYHNVLATLRQIDLLVKDPVKADANQETANNDRDRKDQNQIKTPTKVKSADKKSKQQIPEVSEVISIVKDDPTENSKLHHLIKEVISKNKSVEISHPDFPSIKICSEKHWFIFSGDLSKQVDLFRTSVNEFTVEEKGDEIRRQAFSGSFPKDIWQLVYVATLFGTEGTILEPLQAEDQLYLIEPPEFEKVPYTEQHIAIADYMISHSATVGNVENILKIDLSTVIDFCNACQSVGLLIASGEPQNKLFRLINRIIEQKKSVEITHPDFPPIDICSEKDWFIFPKNLNDYKEMFCIDAGEFSFENRGDEIRKQVFSGTFPKSLWELVYTATMYGTEGKLLKPLQATDRLKLIKKPEFEYVNYTDDHIALANYMVVHSDTVHDIAVNMDISLCDVIDFCNMCQSVNLVERNTTELTSFSEKKEKKEEKAEETEVIQTESRAPNLIQSVISNLGKKD